MKKIAVLLFLIGMSHQIFPQTFQLEWQQCYGGSEPDKARDIIESQGGLYIVGNTISNDGDISYNHGEGDGWLIKTDNIGNILWEKTYGGSNGEYFMRILPTSGNNYYLLGSSASSDGDITNDPYPGSIDYWVVKIDSSGNILWERILGGGILDQLWTGTITDDGGIVAFGWTGSQDGDVTVNYGAYDMWMVKLNSEGEKEWDFSIGTDDFDYGFAIIQTSDGGFLVGGASTIGNGGNLTCEPFNYNAEAILVKLDADRNIEWQQCYGGSDHDGIGGLLEIDDGYIFLAYAGSNDGDISGWHGEDDIWVVKIDFSGSIIWQNPLGGSRYEGALYIDQTIDGNFIVVGMTQSNDGDVSGNHSMSEYDYDIWIAKLSSDGELLSQQCVGGVGWESLYFGVIKKSDNNFVIAGQTNWGPSYDVQCTPHGVEDFWVFEIKDTTTGINDMTAVQEKLKVYPNPARDYVIFELPKAATNNNPNNKSAVIPNQGVGQGARVRNLPTNLDPANKPQGTSNARNSWGVSHATAQSQAQGFDMTTKKEAVVVIVNIFGQTVKTLPVKSEKTTWDCMDVKNGIYFYRVEIEGTVLSGKIVVQK